MNYKLMIYVLSIVMVITNLVFSEENSVQLTLDNKNDLKLTIEPTTGYQANNVRNTALECDTLIKNIVNTYEIHLMGDTLSIMLVQTENNKYYIDFNLDNYIAFSDSFNFNNDVPLNQATIHFKTNFPQISSFKLLRIPEQDKIILLRSNEKYTGMLQLDGEEYSVLFYLQPHHFSYKANGDGLNIAIDLNKNKLIESDEMTKLHKPIMVDSTPLVFTSFSYSNNTLYLKYDKTDQTAAMSKGFIHPIIILNSVKDSTKVSLETYKNKITVINWWGPSCLPCVQEIPELNKLQLDHNSNSEIVFIAINSSSKQEKVKAFLDKTPFNFEQYFVGKEISSELGIGGIPRTIVLDRSGRIVYDQVGYDSEQKLSKLYEVLSLLL